MKTIIIATNNQNKVKEIKSLFDNKNICFKTLKEIGYKDEIIEDGNTFSENALIKAKTIALKYNIPAISDDSGLEVRALNWEPGIYSARYAYNLHDDEENNKLLLKNLEGIEDRYARYACAICLYYPNGKHIDVLEYCEGEIIDEKKGTNGFGYDPYFYIPSLGKTFAEVPLEIKNTMSHRAKALRRLKELINEDFSIKW